MSFIKTGGNRPQPNAFNDGGGRFTQKPQEKTGGASGQGPIGAYKDGGGSMGATGPEAEERKNIPGFNFRGADDQIQESMDKASIDIDLKKAAKDYGDYVANRPKAQDWSPNYAEKDENGQWRNWKDYDQKFMPDNQTLANPDNSRLEDEYYNLGSDFGNMDEDILADIEKAGPSSNSAMAQIEAQDASTHTLGAGDVMGGMADSGGGGSSDTSGATTSSDAGGDSEE